MLTTNDTIPIATHRLQELYDVLGRLLAQEGDVRVMTEVGLGHGRDVFVAGQTVTVRAECGRIIISADES